MVYNSSSSLLLDLSFLGMEAGESGGSPSFFWNGEDAT